MVNYPDGRTFKNLNKNIKFDNRGLDFEYDINTSNNFYRFNKIALIYKKPTPIKVVDMDNKNKFITKAFFEMPSTTDYNGIYKKRYIDFEAKETQNIKSFPLNNIHDHQLNHLKDIDDLGGIAFIIVCFKKLNEIYILDIKSLAKLNRKSIPIDYFRVSGVKVSTTYTCPVNYLKAVDKLYNI